MTPSFASSYSACCSNLLFTCVGFLRSTVGKRKNVHPLVAVGEVCRTSPSLKHNFSLGATLLQHSNHAVFKMAVQCFKTSDHEASYTRKSRRNLFKRPFYLLQNVSLNVGPSTYHHPRCQKWYSLKYFEADFMIFISFLSHLYHFLGLYMFNNFLTFFHRPKSPRKL